MSTCNSRIYTGAFALISDDLRYELYKASAPLAVVASQTFSAPHPARTVNFLGLARVNYIFRLIQETSGGDVSIIDDYNFTPDNDEVFFYSPEKVKVDITTGVTNGTTSFTFDGTAGTPDWRGREMYPERVGQGTMERDVQYSWDTATGEFNLLQPDDIFQPEEIFNITFDPLMRNGQSPVVVTPFSEVLIITGTTTLTTTDIGKKIIIKGATPYFVVTLPEGATVAENLITYFEFGTGSHVNVKIQTFSGDTIDFGKGNLDHITGGVSERISIFWESTVGEWRVHEYDGNFLSVGRIISTDGNTDIECNVQEMDGSNMAVATYKRLYEDFVQKLPPSQVCNYADWGTGDNNKKYSYSNGTNFRVPDRRDLFSRNTDGSRLPGVYQDHQFPTHEHETTTGTLPTTIFGRGIVSRLIGRYFGTGTGFTDLTGPPVTSAGAAHSNIGIETRPENYTIREFILI